MFDIICTYMLCCYFVGFNNYSIALQITMTPFKLLTFVLVFLMVSTYVLSYENFLYDADDDVTAWILQKRGLFSKLC